MVPHDRVSSRRIAHRNFPKGFLRQRDALPGVAQVFDFAFHSINQFLDAHRAWPRRHFANILAEQRVDETALAGLHFPHNDQECRRLEIRQARPENLGCLDVRAPFGQPQSALEQAPERLELLVQFRTQNMRRHRWVLAFRFVPLLQLAHAPPIISSDFSPAHPKFEKSAKISSTSDLPSHFGGRFCETPSSLPPAPPPFPILHPLSSLL